MLNGCGWLILTALKYKIFELIEKFLGMTPKSFINSASEANGAFYDLKNYCSVSDNEQVSSS